MPALPKSSLVGRAPVIPPGRGEGGAIGVPRTPGPMDCLFVMRIFSFEGEGLGLVEGGRRAIFDGGWMGEKLVLTSSLRTC